NVNIVKNSIENNSFYGVTVVDYCLAVAGSAFDCSSNPPEVESVPDDNTYVSNVFKNDGSFFFQAEDGIRYWSVTGVQTCALPICTTRRRGSTSSAPATPSRSTIRRRGPGTTSTPTRRWRSTSTPARSRGISSTRRTTRGTTTRSACTCSTTPR